MKCLLLHCRTFHYKLHHPTAEAEPDAEGREEVFRNALVVFVAVESGDAHRQVVRAAKDFRRSARRCGTTQIVVNPFVHLTVRPEGPARARELGHELVEAAGSDASLDVAYTSFGWYKEFSVDAYGHANSQLFRGY